MRGWAEQCCGCGKGVDFSTDDPAIAQVAALTVDACEDTAYNGLGWLNTDGESCLDYVAYDYCERAGQPGQPSA